MNIDNAQPDDLLLSESDLSTDLWRRIEQHLKARRDRYRIRNDAPLSHDDTSDLRGRIKEITSLLAAGQRED